MIGNLDGVAHSFKSLQSVRRKARLHKNDIGKVLVMETRSVYRALDIQTTLRNAEKNIGNRGDDAGPARRTDHETNFMVLQHDDGRHGGEGTLSGSNCICRALNQPVHVGLSDLRGEVIHLIVEQEAQALGGRAGSEGIVQRIRN